ncbi:DUF488 family protein [Candidatus Marsarchaeota archaeon]|jgi:uncharacterized protein YeaO (DUF488 family)|nr:DUF488 family protein [Candidatus Marsarchaeota archaeon]MCL5092089.1 DUF488 family protein [Candidatus Marsarchaeota archaeon]
MIKIKRVYEKPDIHDGLRILVDRLWPRGIRRSTSNIDLWIKDVAPSMELRKWYSHEEKRWPEFEKRYKEELKDNKGFDKILDIVQKTDPVTLLYSTSEKEHNNAVVLWKVLEKHIVKMRDMK